MRKKLAIATGVLVVVVITFLVARRMTVHALASIDLNVKPFVATVKDYSIQNGAEVVVAKQIIARTRSGEMVHTGEAYGKNGSTLTNIRSLETPDGFVGMIVDSIKAKSTGHRPDQSLAGRKLAILNQRKTCVETDPRSQERLLDEETLYGQRAQRIQVTEGTHRMTSWRLIDFNCQTVQMLIEEKVGADWQTKNGSILTSFVETDPDPALFSGFAGYREMPPSGVVKQYLKDKTGKDYPGNSKQDQQMDKKYAEANK